MPTGGAKTALRQNKRPCSQQSRKRASSPRRKGPDERLPSPPRGLHKRRKEPSGVLAQGPQPGRGRSNPKCRRNEHRDRKPRPEEERDEDKKRADKPQNTPPTARMAHGTRNTPQIRPLAFDEFTELRTRNIPLALSLNWQFLSRKRTLLSLRHPSRFLAWHVLRQAPR